MFVETTIHSIEYFKVKKNKVNDVNEFLSNFSLIGIKTATTKKHILIFPNENTKKLPVDWCLSYIKATLYANCESFDIKIKMN